MNLISFPAHCVLWAREKKRDVEKARKNRDKTKERIRRERERGEERDGKKRGVQ